VGDITIKAVDWLLFNHSDIKDLIVLCISQGRVSTPALTGLGGTGCSSSFAGSEIEEDITTVERFNDIIRYLECLIRLINLIADAEVYLYYYRFEKSYIDIRGILISSGTRRKVSVRTLKYATAFIRQYIKEGLESAGVNSLDLRKMYDMFGRRIRKNKR
jgi:hypothetical protein